SVISASSGVIADSAGADGLCDRLLARQPVRQPGGVVGELLDVEEPRTRNMRGAILGPRIAFRGRQMIGAVDDREVALAEPRGEPFGCNEPAARRPGVVFGDAATHVAALDLTIPGANGWMASGRGFCFSP